MLKQRRLAAEQVAQELYPTEAAIDAAIAQATRFTCAMLQARATANLSAITGHEAMELSGRVISRLLEARREIVEAHKELSVVQGEIGLGAVAFGGGGVKPDEITAAAPQVRQVEVRQVEVREVEVRGVEAA